MQDEVSEAIARRVAPSVTGHEQDRLTRKRPENLSAWEEYLQGFELLLQRTKRTDYEDPGLTQARQHWEKAIELDPTLSDAYAYLAILGSSELVQRITKDPEKDSRCRLADGRKAETSESRKSSGSPGHCYVLLLSGDHPTALDHAQRAVQFNPSFALSLLWQGLAASSYRRSINKVKAPSSRHLNSARLIRN